jgi:hypothetical protein
MRQAEVERAMKQPGGARVIDERKLNGVREELAPFPEGVKLLPRVQDNERA